MSWKASRRACGSNSSPQVLERQTRRRRSARTVRVTPENAGDCVSPWFPSGAQGSACPPAVEGSRTETLCNSYAKIIISFTGLSLDSRGPQARGENPTVTLTHLPCLSRCSQAGSRPRHGPAPVHRRRKRGGWGGARLRQVLRDRSDGPAERQTRLRAGPEQEEARERMAK